MHVRRGLAHSDPRQLARLGLAVGCRQQAVAARAAKVDGVADRLAAVEVVVRVGGPLGVFPCPAAVSERGQRLRVELDRERRLGHGDPALTQPRDSPHVHVAVVGHPG